MLQPCNGPYEPEPSWMHCTNMVLSLSPSNCELTHLEYLRTLEFPTRSAICTMSSLARRLGVHPDLVLGGLK